MESLFGLMDTSMIKSPTQIGRKILPNYPGHYYVAYPGNAGQEVNIILDTNI